MDRLETQLVRMVPSNHTFLLSHYPVATTQFGKSSSGLSFPELANYVSVYFCGHLHELAYGILLLVRQLTSSRYWGGLESIPSLSLPRA
ncbi:hypothetical protein DSO57_1011632 [Entomophthora muscae]|uniref:Uncharacterized protein n=1 Tax=Entomophthora muscae TaxID=34485 RepID=A0ACC2RKV1_9FUNG|nr:hypothetical protein DSO57_1011632 [Entomophthora muscae]